MSTDHPGGPHLRIGAYRGDPAQWDAFVREREGGTHFHLFGWRRVVERVFRHRCIHLAAEEQSRLAPNMLLYWSFMQRAIAKGVRVFNFGRCSPGGGTHRFKSQWGGVDEPLCWYRYSISPRTSTPSPDDPRYRWGPRIWRCLPLRAANALGPHIVRFIP
ncbi:MAG: GNAT family N-acetyltransferase [Gemmatimonadetes bacterium]|nr:GNAT family N-acetyltransferase [Gemmatimonadota bacterium]